MIELTITLKSTGETHIVNVPVNAEDCLTTLLDAMSPKSNSLSANASLDKDGNVYKASVRI